MVEKKRSPFDAIIYTAFSPNVNDMTMKVGYTTGSSDVRFKTVKPAFEAIKEIDLADVDGYKEVYLQRIEDYAKDKDNQYHRGRLEKEIEKQLFWTLNFWKYKQISNTSQEWRELGKDYAVAKIRFERVYEHIKKMLPIHLRSLLKKPKLTDDDRQTISELKDID